MSKTKIEWTDAVWNPVIGCKKVSEGCRNCYAEKMSIRLSSMNSTCSPDYAGILKYADNGKPLGFNGTVKLRYDKLDIPVKKKKPTMFFVNSMSDLFHPKVPFEFIDKVFDVILTNPRHTYQILTKRPDRMLKWCNYQLRKLIREGYDDFQLSNFVWLGVSVEDQKTADERIPLLLDIPAVVKWISAEPLLSSINLKFWLAPFIVKLNDEKQVIDKQTGLNWVVVGGESGQDARPMHPDWVRSIRDQCKASGVPFFFKQWGMWLHISQVGGEHYPIYISKSELFNDETFYRVSKKKAGNLLDGKQHLEYPAEGVI